MSEPYTPTPQEDLGGLARLISPAIGPHRDAWNVSKRAAADVLASRWLAQHDREVAAAAWAAALHHVQPHLAADLHRAAQADNPYRTKEDT